jgi:pimeloyl-ACP methyl ester carboxylesterase
MANHFRAARWLLSAAVLLALCASNAARAQVPANLEAELQKIGQIVDPACTAKLYRPLMPKNDYNTYWPPDAPAPTFKGELYPGITITRDQSFGPHPKDLLDIFVADKGGANRPVLIYVPGGGGNKIEQQVREGNAFYDNIGRWATKNGMVGVTVQRHPGTNWDDGGRDLSLAVDWLKENIAHYKGDPNKMVIWAHSAGNGPLGVYIGHPERWKNGVQVKAAIFMSGNPVPSVGPGRGNFGQGATPGSACGVSANMGSNDGKIAGPSGQAEPAAFGRGPGGRGPAAPELTAEQRAERDNLPGFKASKVKMMIAYAELDPGVTGAKMPPAAVALHDELCKLDGANAKDGEGHCPAMLMGKQESHMSEVFSIDTPDQNVSGPVLAWIKKVLK